MVRPFTAFLMQTNFHATKSRITFMTLDSTKGEKEGWTQEKEALEKTRNIDRLVSRLDISLNRRKNSDFLGFFCQLPFFREKKYVFFFLLVDHY